MTSQKSNVPIGSSMVHLIRSRADSSSTEPLSSTIPPSKPIAPCFLLPNANHKPTKIMMCGPKASGKTSFAMDLAYSCACDFACQCVHQTQCDCPVVLFFRSSSSLGGEEAIFPPTCHRVFDSKIASSGLSEKCSKFYDRTKECNHDFDSSVLKRIKIMYVTSVQDIISELLNVLPQQPCRSIIIDDLDKIATSEQNPVSAMMQTLAIAIETSNQIALQYEFAPIVLATSESPIMPPWIDTFVALRVEQKDLAWQESLIGSALPLSSWTATTNQTDSNRDSYETKYCITKTHAFHRVFWRATK